MITFNAEFLKVDSHPNLYSLTPSSTQVLRELVRNQSPLHHRNLKEFN